VAEPNKSAVKPIFFSIASELRKWFAQNHTTASELLVGFYKVGSGKPSITWPESVDEALCFGWIDGVRRKVDDESYAIRFTPRRPASIWSAVNIKNVARLKSAGRMQAAGLAAYEKRTENGSKIYAYENEATELSSEYERILRSNEKAWAFFAAQAPWYRRMMIHRIMSAKQEKTRASRLGQLIESSEKGVRL
jgi:uncharacterized protein YdeI (YjbR/CyaY-like superfamily)